MTREEAIKWLKDIHHRFNPTGENLENEGGDVHLQALDLAIEALSAEPKTGKWEEVEDYNGDIHYQCDQCGNEFILIDGTPKDNNYHFCPNCGAKIGKGGEDE